MYQTEYGFQGAAGIMQDFGIQSFSDFEAFTEIFEYFTVANMVKMFGECDKTDEELYEIAREFSAEWVESE